MHAVQIDDDKVKAMLIFAYVSRAEAIEQDIKELNAKKSQVFKEARSMKLNDDTLKALLRLRKNGSMPAELKTEELRQYEKLFDQYNRQSLDTAQ